MSLIITFCFILSIIFHKWVGVFFSSLLKPLIFDPLGAVFITYLIIVAIIAFLNFFSGMTRFNIPMPHFNLFPKRNKTKK